MADYARDTKPKTPTPATGELDPTPQTQQAAQAQSAELTGKPATKTDPKKGAASGQADAVREADRVAKAKANWEAVLGKTLGGKAFDLIREHASFSDLQGYAQQGTKALAGLAAAPFSAGKTFSADDAAALNALAGKFAPELQKIADKWLKGPGGQKVAKAISQWIEGNPKAVTAIAGGLGALAIGAAIVAIIADADPPEIKKMFKIGKGFEVGGKLDMASIKRFAVDSAELSMKYSAGGFSASLGGSTKKDGDAHTYAVKGSAAYKKGGLDTKAEGSWDTKAGAAVKGSAAYTKGGFKTSAAGGWSKKDGGHVKGSAEYKKGSFEAKGDVGWSKKDGVSAGGSVKGESGTDRFKKTYLASIRVNDKGETEVVFNGGIKTLVKDMPAELQAGVKHASGDKGSTQVHAALALGKKGDQASIKGSFDPKTGAFTLTFSGAAYKGAAAVKHEQSQDKDGKLTTTQSLNYKPSDKLSINANQTTTDGKTQAGLGINFTTGSFKNTLDLKMKDAKTELRLGTTGKAGNFTLGANTTLQLNDARLKTLGLQLGWKDPKAFKSAVIKYKLDWQKDNKAYAHHFETAFEHSVGKWAGRLKGDLKLQGSQVTSAGGDLLVGRQLNNRWRLLGGTSLSTSFKDGSQATKIGGRLGVQFDNVAVTFGVDKTLGGNVQTGFRLEIPLGK